MLAKLLLCVGISVVVGHQTYQQLIPNGANVVNPCDGSPWPGVGHQVPQGGGARNQFGIDFAAANYTWTVALCMKDSDGDGSTNGAELGDSNCNWATDEHRHVDPVTGHPGICEPLGAARCANSWFSCTAAATSHGPPVGK